MWIFLHSVNHHQHRQRIVVGQFGPGFGTRKNMVLYGFIWFYIVLYRFYMDFI